MAFGKATPRQVLAEMRRPRDKPWWAVKLFNDLTEHLSKVRYDGKPLLDTPLSSAALDAVFEEAIEAVTNPPAEDPIEAMVRETHRKMGLM